MITTCIFDLDGVIVDTAKYHYLAWKKLAEKLGINFSESDNEHLKGVSRIESLELILKMNQKTLTPGEFGDALIKKNNWYLEFIHQIGPEEILPGVSQFLEEVKNEKLNIALGSASKNAKLILKRIGLEKEFAIVIDGNVVTKAKPDPEVFIEAAKFFGAMPDQCIVFEDAVAGIQAAINANMKVVGMGSEHTLKNAHLVLPNFSQVSVKELISRLA